MTEELERPRGILTESDRELLAGFADDLSERAREQRMIRLRRRVRHALMDGLELLEMEPEYRRLIFEPRDEDLQRDVQGGASMLIQFLYMGLEETLEDTDVRDFFQRSIETAERQLAEERDEYVDPSVRVGVDADSVELGPLREKLEAGEYLSDREVTALIKGADLSQEDWEQLRAINEQAVDDVLEPYGTGVSMSRVFGRDSTE